VKTRSILNTIWHWKHSCLEHVLRRNGLLKNIFEGKMIENLARGSKILDIFSDLAVYKEKYVALKKRAEDQKEWQKLKADGSHIPASQQIA